MENEIIVGENETAQSEEVVVKPAWRPQDADREYIKYVTRKKVRNSVVPPNAIFKPAKPTPSIKDEGHKRVAVYARVSTKSTEQVSSIENQTRYYTEKIHNTPNWEMQDIYKDEGISGTSIKHRKDFKRMMADAAASKMDLILCASVSRFARDISDCMEQIRKLKTANPSHPVGVYFETEDIYTLDPNIDERLEMHALFSGWESRNKSRRMILSYDQRIGMGQYPVLDLLGFRHTYEGELIIEPEEAKTVKFIFLACLIGYSFELIAEWLTKLKRTTLTGRTEWNASMVKAILYNERRWGDLEARKTICIDYKDKIIVKNDNQRDGAFIPDHHQGIVTREIARASHCVAASGNRFVEGVMDIGVIERGALKGFVSVCPTWGGVDCGMFIDICKGVYTDEEYEEMVKEARIVTGQESSNVLSMSFTGYEVPRSVYFMNRNTTALTISTKKLIFNKVCRERMDSCEYVEVLYHPILQVLVVRESDANTMNAIKLWNKEKNDSDFIAKVFCNAIYEQLNWIKEYRFKFRGIMRERNGKKLLMFFLDEPLILVGKGKAKNETEVEESARVKYIPYKLEENEKIIDKPLKAYPEQWREMGIGMTYGLRKRRDRWANELTSDDIVEQGKIVVNPLIGIIPSREELEEEVNNLLVAMGG